MVGVLPNTYLVSVSKKYEKNLNLFIYGFYADNFLGMLTADANSVFPIPVMQGLQLVSLVVFVVGAVNIMSFNFDNSYLKPVFILFMIYSLFVSFNGARYDYNSLKMFVLSGRSGILAYITPLVLLIDRNFIVYRKMFLVLLVFGVFYLFFVVFYINILRDPDRTNLTSLNLVEGVATFSMPLGLYLLTFSCHARAKELFELGRKNLFALFVMLVTLYFAIYRARRGLIFIYGTMLISFVAVYFAYAKNKVVPIASVVVAAVSIIIYFSSHGMPSMMQYLVDRGDEDTRTGVEDYFYDDMSTQDMIFGRGINGKYYCPTVENVLDDTGEGYRDNIETGYLNVILKGGMISLVLLSMILFPAVFLGFFKSRNLLSKASAIWIFLWILYQYPMSGVGFSLHYITIWMCVGICYSRKIRLLSDKVVQEYLIA